MAKFLSNLFGLPKGFQLDEQPAPPPGFELDTPPLGPQNPASSVEMPPAFGGQQSSAPAGPNLLAPVAPPAETNVPQGGANGADLLGEALSKPLPSREDLGGKVNELLGFEAVRPPPALPEGFELDKGPQLPAGFQLDTPAGEKTAPSQLAGLWSSIVAARRRGLGKGADSDPLQNWLEAKSNDNPWALPQGFIGGLVGTNPKLMGGAAQAFGVALDSPGLEEVGREVEGFGQKQLEDYKPRVPSYTDVNGNNLISDIGAYLGYSAGNAAATSVPSLIMGIAGTFATGNPLIGIGLGAAGPSYVQNLGDVYTSVRDDPEIKAKIDNGELTPKGVAKASMMAAVPMAILDVISLETILGTAVFGRARKTLMRDIAHGIAIGAISEGSTEGLQEVVSIWAQRELGGNVSAEEAWQRVWDSIIGGAAGGALITGPGAGVAWPAQVRRGAASARALGLKSAEETAVAGPGASAGSVEPPIGGAPMGAPVAATPTPEAPVGPTSAQSAIQPAAEAPPAPEQAAATPAASSDEVALLKSQRWSEQAIAGMEPEERAREMANAVEQGLAPLAPDIPTAEPISDLQAQAKDLADPANPRLAVWLPKASYDALRKDRGALKDVVGSGVRLANFDRQGGVLVAKDQITADEAIAARDRGENLQTIIGSLTGAGKGKPIGATEVVQEVTPEGAVTRESLVTPEEQPQRETELAAPGREVRTVPTKEALKRREDLIQAEAAPIAVETIPPVPEAKPEPAGPTAPVKVASSADIAAAVQRVAEPSEAQKENGNYRKAHIVLQGLPITIENAKGSVRRGTDKDGETWESVLPAHYGYVKRSEGKDGDQVDVFVGDTPESDKVYVVDQLDLKTGRFDEHKAVLGTRSETEARDIYTRAFSDGKGADRIGDVTEMPVAEFKDWLAKGKRKFPVGESAVSGERAAQAEEAVPSQPSVPVETGRAPESKKVISPEQQKGRGEGTGLSTGTKGGLKQEPPEEVHAEKERAAPAKEVATRLEEAKPKPLEKQAKAITAKPAQAASTLAAPTFSEIEEAIGNDENGDVDYERLQGIMQDVAGKSAWTDLTDAERLAVWEEVTGEPVDQVIADQEQLSAREAAAREAMAKPEWRQASTTSPESDTSQQEGFGTPEWQAKRRYVANGQEIIGTAAAAQYLADRARALVPGGVVREHRALLMLGYPGAGKSTVADMLRARFRAAHMTADDAKLIIPEYDNGRNGQGVHVESAHLIGEAARLLVDRGENVLIETIGSNRSSVDGRGEILRDAGYKTALILVDVPKAIAMERAVSRFKETGRAVPANLYERLRVGDIYEQSSKTGLFDERATISWLEKQGWRLTEATSGLEDLAEDINHGALRVAAVGGRDREKGAQGGAGKRRQVELPRISLGPRTRRDSVKAALKMGKTVSLARPARQMLDAIKSEPAILPPGVREAVAERIEPTPEGDFKVTARDANGETLEFYETFDGVSGTVGFFSKLADGTPFVTFFAFEPISSLSNRLKGGRAHEGVHALRELGLLPGSLAEKSSPWGRLLGHAKYLNVMGRSVRSFSEAVDHPRAAYFSDEITMGDAYAKQYKAYPNKSEALDQEAVAHMIQIYVHGKLSEQDAAPVKDLLDAILSGETARGTPVKAEANPRIQDFVGALTGSREGAASAGVEKVTPALEPTQLVASARDAQTMFDQDRATRRAVGGSLKAGRSVSIADDVIAGILDAVRPHVDMVPIGTHVAAVTRLEPRTPTQRNPADVRVQYRTVDGRQAFVDTRWDDLNKSRAVTISERGLSLILVFRVGLPSPIQHGLEAGREVETGRGSETRAFGQRGQTYIGPGLIAHEAVHAARLGTTVRTRLWRRLVEHANGLRLLDMTLRRYYERLGNPLYQQVSDRQTIRSYYEAAYRNAPNLQEALDQEAVAVLAELASEGALAADELAPVADDLRAALGGKRQFQASDREGGPFFALAAPETRETDEFGLYSPSLEAAKAIPQERGTVEQMRSMLLKAGAAPKELDAVGFDAAFPDPQAKVSRGDIERFLRENRVGLEETTYPAPERPGEAAQVTAQIEARRLGQVIPEGTARKDLLTALEDAVNTALATSIIRRIAGPHVRIEFKDKIAGRAARDPEYLASLEAVMGPGRVPKTIGGFYQPGTLDAEPLIALATRDPLHGDLRTRAGHEAWHHVKEALASEAEKRILASPGEQAHMRARAARALGLAEDDPNLANLDPREVEAYAFQRYRREREEGLQPSGLHIATRRLFERILQILRAVLNAMQGLGFATYEDIFESARTGEIAQRQIGSREVGAPASVEKVTQPGEATLESAIPRAGGVTNAQSGGFLGRHVHAALRRADPLRVKLQDKMLPVRRIIEAQRAAGMDVPISMDTYSAEAIFHGRCGERVENLDRDFVEPLIEGMRFADIDLQALDDYLYARHAPERNAAIAKIDPDNLEGSGIPDAEAAQIMGRVRGSGKLADYQSLAKIVDDMQAETLNTLVAAGLMTSEKRDARQTKYPHYVPLRGFESLDEEDYSDRPKSGRGMQVMGPESKQALGRRSKADSPTSYAVMQAIEAIIRSEKNRVWKTLYKNVEANPNPAFWNIYKGEYVKRLNPSTGLVEKKWRAPQTFLGSDNDLLAGKIGGKTVYLEIKHKGLLRAMKGVGAETHGPIINAMMRVMRIYAQLLTSWNLDFTFPNFFRDMGTALGNISDVSEKPANIRRQIVKDAYSFKSVRKILKVLRNPVLTEQINARRKELTEQGVPNLDMMRQLEDEFGYGAWFEDYRLAGGKISFMEYNDLAQIKSRIMSSFDNGQTLRALKGLRDLIEDLNTAVENGVRLSTYVALRKHNVPQDRAAFVARELTTNFNRKGEWGSAINGMYLFFNASAQGTTRIAQALYRSRALRYGIGGIFAAAMALDWWNALSAGEDDDGNNYYDDIPDWIKERNLIIVIGSDREDYVMVPLPYGYNVPFLAGQQLGAVVRGKKKPLVAAGNIGSAAMESFNPLGSAVSFWQYISPTALDPGVQMLENKTWFGSPIYPTKYDKRLPDSQLAWPSTPKYWTETARVLNELTGGNIGRPGYFDVSPETLQHYAEFAGGGVGKFVINAFNTGTNVFSSDEWLPEKTPILRRFYGKATSVSKRRQFYDAWNEVDAAFYEVKTLTKNGLTEQAKAARARYPAQLRVHGQFKNVMKALHNMRTQREAIKANDKLSEPEKKKRLDRIVERENEMVLRALKVYHEAVRMEAEKNR